MKLQLHECRLPKHGDPRLELPGAGYEAGEAGQVFIRQAELDSTFLFEMIALTVNQCVTDGRMVDALRPISEQGPPYKIQPH
jgi:hypothetical protein